MLTLEGLGLIFRQPLPTGKIYVKIKQVQSAMNDFNTTCSILGTLLRTQSNDLE